jgi:filamentous hemagglutinin family protein
MGYRSGWRWSIVIASLVAPAAGAPLAGAQSISGDGSFGSVVSPGPNFTIGGGTAIGPNLFHSFSQFSIGTGESAAFVTGGATSIFARVTGPLGSVIDGAIGTQSPANLFLLNPNGIIFGPNASLNLNGSFLGTTASSIDFSNDSLGQSRFGLTTVPTDLLGISAPIGLQMGLNPGEIQVQPRSLLLQASLAQSLALVGGEITLDGASLRVDGGQLSLAALDSGAAIGLSLTNGGRSLTLPIAAGTAGRGIQLLNGSRLLGGTGAIATYGAGGIDLYGASILGENSQILQRFYDSPGLTGNPIALQADQIRLRQSSVISEPGQAIGSGQSGDIQITAGNLAIEDGSYLATGVIGADAGGAIAIRATGLVSLTSRPGFGLSGIYNNSRASATAPAGPITIAADRLTLSNGSEILARSGGQGNSGSITIVTTGGVSLQGQGPAGQLSRINTALEATGVGQAGQIDLTAASLDLADGAELNSFSAGRGDAGAITVTVTGQIRLAGGGGPSPSRISSELLRPPDHGRRSGSITIKAGSLLSEGGLISSAMYLNGVTGYGGAINLTADQITLGDVPLGSPASENLIGILTAGYDGSWGSQAGQITIRGGDLTVRDGAGINSNGLVINGLAAGADGVAAGAIDIQLTGDVSVRGSRPADGLPSAITAQVLGNGSAPSGSIDLRARNLTLSDGGFLATATTGLGLPGKISLTIQNATQITGQPEQPTGQPSQLPGQPPGQPLRLSGIYSGIDNRPSSPSTQTGGTIQLTSDSLTLVDGLIATDNLGQGDGGQITIATHQLSLLGSRIGANASGDAGQIAITGQDLAINGIIEANAIGQGLGGQINLRATGLLSLDGGQVLAEQQGTGSVAGNLTIVTPQLRLINNSQISADAPQGATAGTIAIQADQITADNNSDISALSNGGPAGFIDLTVTQLNNIALRSTRTAGNDITIGRPVVPPTVTPPVTPPGPPVPPPVPPFVSPMPDPSTGPSTGPIGMIPSPISPNPESPNPVTPSRPQGIRLQLPQTALFYGGLTEDLNSQLAINGQPVQEECQSRSCIPIGRTTLSFAGFCMERYGDFVVTGRGVAPIDPRQPLTADPHLWRPESPPESPSHLPRSVGQSFSHSVKPPIEQPSQAQSQTSGLTLAPCQT